MKMMIESNCPTCNQRRKFSETDEKKYMCGTCKTTSRLCKSKNCNNMIKIVPICKECVGKGLKNGGAVVLASLLSVSGIAIKAKLKKGK